MFKFFIENIDYTNEVDELLSISRQVNYNEANYTWVSSFPTSFTAVGSLFAMLRNRIIANQFDTKLSVEVKKFDNGNYYPIFTGELFISDLECDLSRNRIKFSLVNTNWQSRIENNLEVPVSTDARSTKNGLFMSPCGSIVLDAFSAKNKTTLVNGTSANVTAYDIGQLFNHITTYISDGEVTYYSQYLNTKYLPLFGKLAVTTGYNIRTGGSNHIQITFKKLFDACRKLLNLVMYFEESVDGQVLRIENEIEVFNASVGQEYNDVQNVSLKFKQAKFYSAVKVGATTSFQNNTEISDNYYYPKVEGMSYGEEQFSIETDVNINNVLDLTINDFIYDHNKIEDCLGYGNEEYDDELFFICYSGTSTKYPILSDDLQIQSITNNIGFYNQALLTKKTIERHRIYGDLVNRHGIGSDTFLAFPGFGDFYSNFPVVYTQANPITSYYPYSPPFPNDNTVVTFGSVIKTPFDNNGNFSTALNRFTAPSTGLYRFQTKDHWSVLPITSNFYHFYAILTVYNSSNTAIKQYVRKHKSVKFLSGGQFTHSPADEYIDQLYNNAPEPYDSLESFAIDGGGGISNPQYVFTGLYELQKYSFEMNTDNVVYLDSGDYVTHSVVFVESDFARRNNSNGTPSYTNGYGASFIYKSEFFGCNYSLNGGDVIINTTDGSGNLRNLSFEVFLTDGQIRDIINNSQMKIRVKHDGYNFVGKILNFTVNDKKNICKFDLEL